MSGLVLLLQYQYSDLPVLTLVTSTNPESELSPTHLSSVSFDDFTPVWMSWLWLTHGNNEELHIPCSFIVQWNGNKQWRGFRPAEQQLDALSLHIWQDSPCLTVTESFNLVTLQRWRIGQILINSFPCSALNTLTHMLNQHVTSCVSEEGRNEGNLKICFSISLKWSIQEHCCLRVWITM